VLALQRIVEGDEVAGVDVGQQVSVAVDGRGDAAVPEPALDRGQRSAGGDEPGGVGVSQVVDPQPLQLGRSQSGLPDAGHEVLVSQGSAGA